MHVSVLKQRSDDPITESHRPIAIKYPWKYFDVMSPANIANYMISEFLNGFTITNLMVYGCLLLSDPVAPTSCLLVHHPALLAVSLVHFPFPMFLFCSTSFFQDPLNIFFKHRFPKESFSVFLICSSSFSKTSICLKKNCFFCFSDLLACCCNLLLHVLFEDLVVLVVQWLHVSSDVIFCLCWCLIVEHLLCCS